MFPTGHGTTCLPQAVEYQPYKNWFKVDDKTISLKPFGLHLLQATSTPKTRSNTPTNGEDAAKAPAPAPAPPQRAQATAAPTSEKQWKVKPPTSIPPRPATAPSSPASPKQWIVMSDAQLLQMELGVERDCLTSPSEPNMLIMDLRVSSGYVGFAFVLEDGTLPTIQVSKEKIPRALQEGHLLRRILASPQTVKVAHDLYEGAAALREHGLADYLDPVFDMQLATEIAGKHRNICWRELFGVTGDDLLQTLGLSAVHIFESLGEEMRNVVIRASKARLSYAVSDDYATKNGRPISYLPESNTFGSAELWDIVQDQPVIGRSTLHINVEIESVLQLVPRELFSDFEGCLVNEFTHR